MMTDRLYHHGALKALQLQSMLSSTYFYFFRYRIKNGDTSGITVVRNSDVEEISESFLGVSHGDDVFLIYNNPSSRDNIPYSNDEIIVSNQLINLYQNFSYDDSPIYDLLKIKEVDDEVNCLEILGPKNYKMTVKDESFGHSKFWDDLEINDS